MSHSTEVRPLFLHGAQPHHIDALKAAKAELELGFLVKPVQAGPGDRGVLSFAGRPDFICEWQAVESREAVPMRLKWALGLVSGQYEGYAEWMTAVMGKRVWEVTE
jgi:hypothetical protein